MSNAIKAIDFVHHDSGLVGAVLSTPKGDLRFVGCWDPRTDKWHENDQPLWSFHSRNPNGSLNIEDLVYEDVPQPKKPTKRSFEAAVRAWFHRNPA